MTNDSSSCILNPKPTKIAPEFKTLITRHKSHHSSRASIPQTSKRKIRNQIPEDRTEIEESADIATDM